MAPRVLTVDEAIAFTPVSVFHYRLLLLCGLAFMTDSLEINLLTFLAACAGDEWNLSDSKKATIASVVFVGMLIGNFFWGIFSDRYGRKKSFLLACSCMTIGGFLSGAAPSYVWLVIFRLLVGIGVGGAVIPFDLLAEFVPSSSRGLFLIYIDFFWALGSMFCAALAWVSLSQLGWRYFAILSTVPVVLASVLGYFMLPESPRWLLMKGRREEAERVIREAALISGVEMPEFTLEPVTPQVRNHTYLDLLSTKYLRRIALPLWVIWLMFGFTYYGYVLYVSRVYSNLTEDGDPDLIGEDTDSCAFNYEAIFANATAEIVGVISATFLIERIGRRGSQLFFYTLGGIAVFVMGFDIPLAGLGTIAFIGRLSAMASTGVTRVTTPELYPTEIRTMGHSIGAAWAKIGAFLSAYLIVSDISHISLAVMLASMNFIAGLASLMLPETAGRELDFFRTTKRDKNKVEEILHTPFMDRKNSEAEFKPVLKNDENPEFADSEDAKNPLIKD